MLTGGQMANDGVTHLLLLMKCDEIKLLTIKAVVVNSLAIGCIKIWPPNEMVTLTLC